MTIRPPTPPGWSDTDWLKHLEEVTPAKRHHYDMTEAIEIIAKLRAERDALAAELDDHRQQLRKEQLEVQSLHEKLAELAHDLKNAAEWKGAFVTLKDRMAELELQEPVGYVYMHNGMTQGALTDKAMKAGTPLYKRGTP